MPSKHSKNGSDRSFFTYNERKKSESGTKRMRLGAEAQLPFGWCPFTISPIDEGVVSPSGRIYSKEAILEYLLNKTCEIKEAQRLFEEQERKNLANRHSSELSSKLNEIRDFACAQDSVLTTLSQKVESQFQGYVNEKRKKIDETSIEDQRKDMAKVCPWVPEFTPTANPAPLKAPPKRPASPFSHQSLRTKDLIPIDLVRDPSDTKQGETTRFICPVSKKIITNQKVILIKSTGSYMLESVAEELAFPTLQDPISGKSFKRSDVITLVPAASGFAASGNVVAKKFQPSLVC